MVEPPRTAISRRAFSNDFFVTISKGFKSCSINPRKALPTDLQSSIFSILTAGLDELYGNPIPNASIAEAIVLAVYIPPHAPAPGQAFLITFLYSLSSIFPATFSPQASKAETTSNSLSRIQPEAIVPP